jgi:hypothetical protein
MSELPHARARPKDRRDRVTVDLRGAGRRLHERAAAQGMTVSLFARRTLLAGLEAPAEPAEPASGDAGAKLLKVTVRLSPSHALLLSYRARKADLSQGSYLAALLDGTPPAGLSLDRREVLKALASSTDQLSIISLDLNAYIRLLGRANAAQLEPYPKRILSLDTDVRSHLALASSVLAQISPLHSRRAKPTRRG